MKKNIIYTLLLLFCSFSFFKAQSDQDKKQINAAVTDILKGFQARNSDLMNRYVNKAYGVGVLFKSSGDLGFVLNEDVDFSMPLGYIEKAWNINNQFPAQFGSAPAYDPEHGKWKKEGLFVQAGSNIINEYADQFRAHHTMKDQDIFKINSDPKNVVFVTLAENSKEKAPVNGFRFILTKVEARWYLTFIDVTAYHAE